MPHVAACKAIRVRAHIHSPDVGPKEERVVVAAEEERVVVGGETFTLKSAQGRALCR